MQQSLSSYFHGISAKRLSEVEINPNSSNQHEFNGINKFKSILGTEKQRFQGTFIYLNDDPNDVAVESANLTWYDARENHAIRTEYRLYYTSNPIINAAKVGDLIIIAKTTDNELAVIVASKDSTSEQQMMWLFGLEQIDNSFEVKDFKRDNREINFAGKHVISSLGIEIQENSDSYLEQILENFGEVFPKTSVFSEFARSTVKDVSPIEEPDESLVKWLEREELLFKTLEKHIVSKRLSEGFGADGRDVDEFVKYSLSVHNRRKSRAGHSFENHLMSIFSENQLMFSRGQKTERNNRPDFLFPGIEYYQSPQFTAEFLTMLGVKTSVKDRWRQVLSEADRIEQKHLITMQPAISLNQTAEMRQQKIQLIVPAPLFETFHETQRIHLINLTDFIKLIKEKQDSI